jgi:hypothetical protein
MTQELTIHTVKDISIMAEAVFRSGLFGIKTRDQAMALMMLSQAEGLHPMIAARDFHIINGKPSKTSEAMQRSFMANGGKIEWVALDDTRAEAKFSHPDGGQVTILWTFQMAEKAGLTGNPTWKKFPRAMLRARCVSEGIRTIYPGATSGMYVQEEVQDFGPPKDVTPHSEPEHEVKPEPKNVKTEKTDEDIVKDITTRMDALVEKEALTTAFNWSLAKYKDSPAIIRDITIYYNTLLLKFEAIDNEQDMPI